MAEKEKKMVINMIDLPQTRSISLKSYIEDIKKSIKDGNYLSVLCISLIITNSYFNLNNILLILAKKLEKKLLIIPNCPLLYIGDILFNYRKERSMTYKYSQFMWEGTPIQ